MYMCTVISSSFCGQRVIILSRQHIRVSIEIILLRIMPWQFGQLGLTESGGNRLIKYADALINGVRQSCDYSGIHVRY